MAYDQRGAVRATCRAAATLGERPREDTGSFPVQASAHKMAAPKQIQEDRTMHRFAPLVAVLALVGAAPLSTADDQVAADSDTGSVRLNRNLTQRQAAFAVRLQCLKGFRQCQRTIPGAALWSDAGYDLEYTGCCTEFGACVDLVQSLDRSVARDTDELYDLACAVNIATSTAANANDRRKALLEGARQAPLPDSTM